MERFLRTISQPTGAQSDNFKKLGENQCECIKKVRHIDLAQRLKY